MRPTVFRVDETSGNPNRGRIRWAPLKSIWINTCLVVFVASLPFATSVGSVVLFALLTYLTLLFGHSVGMHRKLIHRTYDCPKWLERLLAYLGVVVGMAGPFGVIIVHDVRDWAQRQPSCHDFFSHRAPFWKDAFWQLNCRFEFENAPVLEIEPDIADDPFLKFLNRTWVLQQLPLGAVFFMIGGWSWVAWGIFGRVFVSVAGHWTVTYLTHNPGPGRWVVPSAGVQASNLPGYGFMTMGECWHNNHHAFPESARIGLEKDEFDPGWEVIRWLENAGWAWNVGQPRPEGSRRDLRIAASAREVMCDDL